jgi:hypothetical protein
MASSPAKCASGRLLSQKPRRPFRLAEILPYDRLPCFAANGVCSRALTGLEEWVQQGWNADDATAYMQGYYDNLALQAQEEYLRIPGAAEYWHELDVRVSAVLAGQTSAKAALDDTYKAWEQITERFGREGQKKLYQASFVS